MSHKHTRHFPQGFLWGAATAAHQIEGNNTTSDWWAWEHSPGRMAHLRSEGKDPKQYYSGEACDSYHRFDEDFALAESLSHNAHRMSIEWARIEPTEGEFSEAELSHYKEVFRSAKSHGLTLFVTLHHMTSPLWFAQRGGFSKEENICFFTRYADTVAKRLGQHVDFWITINEPEAAVRAYLTGDLPPQRKSFWLARRVVKNMVQAHIQAYGRLKSRGDQPISMAFHFIDLVPTNIVSRIVTVKAYRAIAHFAFNRAISHCDYIGLNYYLSLDVGTFLPGFKKNDPRPGTYFGYPIRPEGLLRLLRYLASFDKPVYITENGIMDATDSQRERFIRDHLTYAHEAIQEGADLRGYLHWSLIDNFEWDSGFVPKFGLAEVERPSLRRIPRPSAYAYAQICKNNAL